MSVSKNDINFPKDLIELNKDSIKEIGVLFAEKRLLNNTSGYSVKDIHNIILMKIENGQNVNMKSFLRYCEKFDIKLYIEI